MAIHPGAHVHPAATIDPSAEIGPGCIVEEGVVIGADCRLWANCYVAAGTTVGPGNELHMGVVLGHAPQDLTYDGAPTRTRIGARNVFRENVTVHRASRPGGETRVGDDCLLMVNAHVAHDCRVGSNVIMANGATLAGHADIGDGAFLSAAVFVHQFVRVGRLVMLAGLSTVLQDFPPFSLGGGRRAQVHGLNVVGLRRAGIDADARHRIQRDQRILYRDGLTTSEALEVLREERSPETNELIAFIEGTRRGLASFGAAERETDDSGAHLA
ncbi:MAG: acyl-ACP--UDP-N-acetylglucosamine O-acyltransferase [Planctomycetota bacterium]